MEVEGPARILRRCAERPVGTSSAVSAAEDDLNARCTDFIARCTPGHRGLAPRAGNLFTVPINGKVALLEALSALILVGHTPDRSFK
jgi:hypothetical protein